MTKIDCKCRIQLEFQTPSILGFCKPEWQFDLLVAATNQGETSSQSVPLYSVQGYMFYPSDFSIILTIILCGFFPGFFSQNNSYLLIFFPLFNSLIFSPFILFFVSFSPLFPFFSIFYPWRKNIYPLFITYLVDAQLQEPSFYLKCPFLENNEPFKILQDVNTSVAQLGFLLCQELFKNSS